MALKSAVIVMILLISAVGLAGCTGSPPAPVPTPDTRTVVATVVSTPAHAATAAMVVTAVPPVERTNTFVPDPTHAYSKTYTFEATGDYDEHTFTTTSDRTWVFRMSCPAKEEFIVTLKDGHGDDIDVLADASGVYAGTESVWLKAGTYRLDVKADAPWTITMSTE